MNNNDEPLVQPQMTQHEAAQQNHSQPMAIQKWLREERHQEQWHSRGRVVEEPSATEAEILLEALEQDMAQDAARLQHLGLTKRTPGA
jgi:hypothetical protein